MGQAGKKDNYVRTTVAAIAFSGSLALLGTALQQVGAGATLSLVSVVLLFTIGLVAIGLPVLQKVFRRSPKPAPEIWTPDVIPKRPKPVSKLGLLVIFGPSVPLLALLQAEMWYPYQSSESGFSTCV